MALMSYDVGVPAPVLHGYVEVVQQNTIAGWIGIEGPLYAGCVQCVLTLDGVRYSTEATSSDRLDLTHLPWAGSFRIPLESEEAAYEAIASGSAQFTAICGGTSATLKILPSLIYRAIRISFPKETDHERERMGAIGYGASSPCGDAVVGAGGTLLLRGGVNDVASLYNSDAIDAAAWAGLVHERKAQASKAGMEFRQIFIPEKSSQLHWKCPFEATKGSKGYNEVIRKLEEDEFVGEDIVDLLSLTSNDLDAEKVYRDYDTHLSTYGAETIARYVAERYRLIEDEFPKPTATFFGRDQGDLGSKFGSEFIERPVLYRAIETASQEVCQPHSTVSWNPSEGLTGTKRSWRCPQASIDAVAVCFGNSFFERGETSTTLSWWFARLFREFHFIWSASADMAVASRLGADLVICQTNERFMTKLPSN
ncbi:hypothetical protein [Ensifer sp. LBL]|uniref:hypothetical protein n=1 Tax=Ensifer sp. LBL TaxID=2991056 RepID=UPI003D1AD799